MVRSVGLYLTRFDEEPEAALQVAVASQSENEAVYIAEPPLPPPISEEIRQSLVEEGRVAAKAEFDVLVERERAEFETRLQQERDVWASEEGSRLGKQFNHAICDLVTNLETSIEKILEPFVVQGVRKKMLTSLITQLHALLADHERPVIQLSGPMDLLEVICTELNAADVSTIITEVGGIDVKARLDATLIETSIQDWIQHLHDGDKAP
jgi:hypothetical protein